MGNVIGTSFATAGFSYDANISPNNQSFSGAVLAVTNRNPAGLPGTGTFINLTVTGTATINALQVTTATIATENVSTATIAQLVAGTGTFSQLTASGTATFGSIKGFGATAGGLVDATPDTGSFTGTGSGFSGAAPTIPCVWARVGNVVTVTFDSNNSTVTGTSNATTFGMSGLPAEITPAHTAIAFVAFLWDNGADTPGVVQINPNGVIQFYKGTSGQGASWTGSGQKGFNGSFSVAYPLN